jgi:hypothetical protein
MKCLFESVECEHRNTGGCSRGDCVFAPQDNAESPSHSIQQLKAEIAAYVTKLEADYHGGCGVNINRIIERLRQLSAV